VIRDKNIDMTTDSSGIGIPGGARAFATTRWSVVLAAGGGESVQARDAMGRLCQIYWYPLYAFARRRGYSGADAQDLAQEFFAELISKKRLAGVERVSRFRAYLLTAFKHFLAKEYEYAQAQKRGGGVLAVALDAGDADRRYAVEPVCDRTPESLFERQWALALLEQALARVESDYHAAGKQALFDALKPGLTSGAGLAHAEIAAQLNVTEGAIKVAAHRLRQRYRDELRAEIAETVSNADEVEDELRCLMLALSG